MHQLCFEHSYIDPDVWYCNAGDRYKYVCTYVDDLLVAMKGPNTFMKQLQSDPWNYKLKDVGLPKYYFGGAFFCDNNGTLCYGSQIYAKHMCDNYFQLFREDLPPKMHSASIKEDYPKLDVSDPCGSNDTAKFQSLIGALQRRYHLFLLFGYHQCRDDPRMLPCCA